MLAELKGECPAPIDEVTFVCSLRIEDKVSGGLIPFALWDCQIDLLKRLDSEPRLFALKSRQSWASPGRCWRTCSTWRASGATAFFDRLADRR